MGARQSSRDLQMRQRIAQEAARVMVEEGVRDYYAAKRKAAAHLGARETQNMPRNVEIEEALQQYQRLFQSDSQPEYLRSLRLAAREAMQFLSRFEPRLVGAVLSGSAGQYSDVDLHLFADTPEEVALFLMQSDIPFENAERRLKIGRNEYRNFPGFRLVAGEHVLELTVFPLEGLREAPRSSLDGKPMRRATLVTLDALLEED
ncbi:MAG TPA: hypothetical protein VKA76_06930 [Gammaproteobacteria bacterium]|nr:hypothetical protein [Gammaproteobacteria bacterium]